MNKLFFVLLSAVFLISCEEDDVNNSSTSFAPVTISADAKDAQVRELFKNDILIIECENASKSTNKNIVSEYWDGIYIDTISAHITVFDADVIQNGVLNPLGGSFLSGRNYVVREPSKNKVVAYIPNELVRSIQAEVVSLGKSGKIAEISSLLQTSLSLIPCTDEGFVSIREEIDWQKEFYNLSY